jgi:hypothetical protein
MLSGWMRDTPALLHGRNLKTESVLVHMAQSRAGASLLVQFFGVVGHIFFFGVRFRGL